MICGTFVCATPATARDLSLKGRDNGPAAAGWWASHTRAKDGVKQGTYQGKKGIVAAKSQRRGRSCTTFMKISVRIQILCWKHCRHSDATNGSSVATMSCLLPNMLKVQHQYYLDAKFGDLGNIWIFSTCMDFPVQPCIENKKRDLSSLKSLCQASWSHKKEENYWMLSGKFQLKPRCSWSQI